jgi:cytochrome P450
VVALAPQAGASLLEACQVEQALDLLLAAVPESDPEPAANQIALLFQAIDATAGLVTNSVLADPAGRWPAAALVRDVARWDPPVQHTRRRVAGPTTIGGVELPVGDVVVVLLAAAARDPATVVHPDVLDPARTGRSGPDIGFGSGAHCCPGDDLAPAIAAGIVDAARLAGRRPANRAGALRTSPQPSDRRPPHARRRSSGGVLTNEP